MAFTSQEVTYFAVMWSCTFIAGLCRTLRDRDYISPWDCIAVGVVGGFYGFAIVAVCSYYGPSFSDFGWGYLGISTAIGSLGKEQDRFTRAIFARFFRQLLGPIEDQKNRSDAGKKEDS